MSNSRYYFYRLTIQSGREKLAYLLKVDSNHNISVVNSRGLELTLIQEKNKEKLYLSTIKRHIKNSDDQYITLMVNRFSELCVHGSGNKKVTLEKIFGLNKNQGF